MASAGATGGDIGQVLQALQALYGATDKAHRSEANKWLEVWQKSDEAWMGADTMLRTEGAGEQAQYFAANTLKYKTRRDLHALNESARASLLDSVLNHIVSFRSGPGAVRTQLCLCLTELAIMTDKWQSVVPDILNRLGQQQENVAVTVQLLTIIAEEATCRGARELESAKRIRQDWQPVMGYLHSAGASIVDRPDGKKAVLRAFARWVPCCADEAPSSQLVASPLVKAATEVLDDPDSDVFADATEVIVALAVASKDVQKHAPLVQLLCNLMPKLSDLYSVAVDREDDDVARCVARILSEMGCSYTELLVTGSADAITLVQNILKCTSHKSPEVAGPTHYFWTELSDALSGPSLEGPALEEEQRRRIAVFAPAFVQLVDILRAGVEYPEDVVDWGKEEAEDFRQFRNSTADTLLDSALVIPAEQFLVLLVPKLEEAVGKIQQGVEFEKQWRAAEAVLYCVRVIARTVERSENEAECNQLLARVYNTMGYLPAEQLCMRTAVDAAGRFTRFLMNNPAHLQPVFQMLARALQLGDECATRAANAVRNICEDCTPRLQPFCDSLIGLLALSNLDLLSPEGAKDLVAAVGPVILYGSTSVEMQHTGMQRVASEVFTAVGALATQSGQEILLRRRLLYLGEMMKRYVPRLESSMAHPWSSMFQTLWPSLEMIFKNYGSDEQLMEQLCRVVKYSISNLSNHVVSILPSIANTLVNNYRANPLRSSYMYAMSPCLTVFHSGPKELVDALFAMFESVAVTVFGTLKESHAWDQHPDVVEEFFELSYRVCRDYSKYVLQWQLAQTLLECALSALNMHHKYALVSVIYFIDKLHDIQPAPNSPFVTRHGEILQKLLNGSCGTFDDSVIPVAADCFRRLFLIAKTGGNAQAVVQLVEQIPSPPGVDDIVAQRQAFYSALESSSSSDLQAFRIAYRKFCRAMSGRRRWH